MIARLFAALAALCLALAPVPASAAMLNLPLTGAGSNGVSLIAAPFVSVNGASTGPGGPWVGNSPYNGWSAEYSGSPPNAFTPSATAFSVTRTGYDAAANATTYVDTFFALQGVRQPYPNQTSSSANTGALSDYVYSTDVVAGATNNSGTVSPKPIAAWVTPARSVITTSISAEIITAHRNARNGREVAAVQCRATDSLAVTVYGPVVYATTVSGRAGDKNPVIVTTCTVDTTTLADGVVTLNAMVYPWIGASGSVLDSASSSVAREFSPRYFWKSSASPYYVYVKSAGAGGNDTTCVASQTEATAAASPCATVSSAAAGALFKLNATAGKVDGGIIKVNDAASFVLTTPTAALTQNAGCVTITKGPNVTRAQAVVTFGLAAWRPKLSSGLVAPVTTGCVRFADITVQRTGSGAITGEAANNLEIQWDDIDFDNGSQNFTWLASAHDYMTGFTAINLTGNSPLGAGTNEHRLTRGLSVSIADGQVEGWWMFGSTITRPGVIGRGSRSFSGAMFGFNRFLDMQAASTFAFGADENVSQIALLQNLVEWTSATTNPALRVSADSASGGNDHMVVHYNTFVGAWQGGRWNAFYDEGATARSSTRASVIGNVAAAFYTKGDFFRGAVQGGGDASTRLGNWAYLYGSGTPANYSQYSAAGILGTNEAQAYGGVGSLIGTSTSAPQTADNTLYANYQALRVNASLNQFCVGAAGTYCAGAAGGSYVPASSSVPIKGIVASAVLSHDLAGTARPTTLDTAGAYVAP